MEMKKIIKPEYYIHLPKEYTTYDEILTLTDVQVVRTRVNVTTSAPTPLQTQWGAIDGYGLFVADMETSPDGVARGVGVITVGIRAGVHVAYTFW